MNANANIGNYLCYINFQIMFQKLLKNVWKPIHMHKQEQQICVNTEFVSSGKYMWEREGEHEISELLCNSWPISLPQFNP